MSAAKVAAGCSLSIALFVLAVAVFAVTGYMTHAPADTFGHALAMATLPFAIGALSAGMALPFRRVLGASFALVLLVLVGVCAAATTWWARNVNAPMRADERATPTLVGDRLVQRALGFSMPAPVGLALVPDDPVTGEMLASDPSLAGHAVAWRWADATESTCVLVMVDLEAIHTPTWQRDFFASMVGGTRESLPGQGMTVTGEEDRGPLDHVIRASANGHSLTFRSFGYPRGNHFAIVSLTTIGADPEVARVLDGAALN